MHDKTKEANSNQQRFTKSVKVLTYLVIMTSVVVCVSLFAGGLSVSASENRPKTWVARTPEEINIEDKSAYIIEWGDTLWAISQVANVSIQDLVEINNIVNHDLIYAGDTLVIDDNIESLIDSNIDLAKTPPQKASESDNNTFEANDEEVFRYDVINQKTFGERSNLETVDWILAATQEEIDLRYARVREVMASLVDIYGVSVLEGAEYYMDLNRIKGSMQRTLEYVASEEEQTDAMEILKDMPIAVISFSNISDKTEEERQAIFDSLVYEATDGMFAELNTHIEYTKQVAVSLDGIETITFYTIELIIPQTN